MNTLFLYYIIKDAPFHIPIDPFGLYYLSINFSEFSQKPVYPTMVVKNNETYGVQITRMVEHLLINLDFVSSSLV